MKKCVQPAPMLAPVSNSVWRPPSPLSWSRRRLQALSAAALRSTLQNQPPTSKPIPCSHLLLTCANGSTPRGEEKLWPRALKLLGPSSPPPDWPLAHLSSPVPPRTPPP